MKRLSILHVCKLYFPVTGGVERVAQQIAQGLRAQTDSMVLTCQKKGSRKMAEINCVPVWYSHSFGMAYSMPLSLSFLVDFYKNIHKRDILQLHMPFPLGDLALFLSRYRGKVVLWWHSDIVKQKKLLLLYKPLLKWTLRRADAIIVATQGHIDGSDFLPAYQHKCKIIPFGVEPKIMDSASAYLQRHNATEDGKLHFLFVGRLVYYKGCDILLKAFAHAALPNADLTIVGEGPLKEDLLRLAQSLNLEHCVIWKNMLDDATLANAFAACDVFVLPSVAKSEAFGLVQIEAMAYQKPVINTKLPSGVPFVSLNNETGLTVESSNVNQLAKAICWMAEHPEERKAMGICARQRVQDHFTMEQMLEKTLALYETLVI